MLCSEGLKMKELKKMSQHHLSLFSFYSFSSSLRLNANDGIKTFQQKQKIFCENFSLYLLVKDEIRLEGDRRTEEQSMFV